jgi:hypothetical protein
MQRYYFDLRDDDGLTIDDEGIELPDLRAVRYEASRSVVDAARNVLLRPTRPTEVAVEVRDESGPVIRMRFVIDIEEFRGQGENGR